ncbi:MAG: DNA cytosine methyltransferase, partial [Bacteroidaceae bacterium]
FDSSEEIKEKYEMRAVRPLAPKTMERIARGLKKFVINNQEPFIVQCKSQDIKNTLRKITTENQPCVISPTLIQYHSETTDNGVRGQAIEEPIMTVDSSNRYGLVSAFLQKYISGGYKWNGKSLEEPLPAVTSINHNSICTSHIIQMNNHCDGNNIENPIHTIVAGDGHFGEVRAFLVKYYGDATGQKVENPLDTITTHDRFGLVTVQGVNYKIEDIGLRMLEPRELYGCQGFPDDYVIDKDFEGKAYSRKEQIKRCGNAVPPPFANALVKANLPELCICERTQNLRIDKSKLQLRFV